MAEAIDNYRIGSVSLVLGATNLGFTDESTTVVVGTEYADITVDKYGSTLVDKRVMGRSVTITTNLKQTSKSDLADVWAKAFPANDGAGVARIDLAAETNDSMRALGAVLVLKRRNSADATENFTFWKAAVTEVGDMALNNEGETLLPVTFTCFIDETNGLMTFGDSTA